MIFLLLFNIWIQLLFICQSPNPFRATDLSLINIQTFKIRYLWFNQKSMCFWNNLFIKESAKEGNEVFIFLGFVFDVFTLRHFSYNYILCKIFCIFFGLNLNKINSKIKCRSNDYLISYFIWNLIYKKCKPEVNREFVYKCPRSDQRSSFNCRSRAPQKGTWPKCCSSSDLHVKERLLPAQSSLVELGRDASPGNKAGIRHLPNHLW